MNFNCSLKIFSYVIVQLPFWNIQTISVMFTCQSICKEFWPCSFLTNPPKSQENYCGRLLPRKKKKMPFLFTNFCRFYYSIGLSFFFINVWRRKNCLSTNLLTSKIVGQETENQLFFISWTKFLSHYSRVKESFLMTHF